MLTPDTVPQYLQARQLLLDKFPPPTFVNLTYEFYRHRSGIVETYWAVYIAIDNVWTEQTHPTSPLAAAEELIKLYDKRGI